MSDASKYGSKYFCIRLTDKKGTEVYVYADDVRVEASGTLVLIGGYRTETKIPDDGPQTNLAFAPGQWACIYAASAIGGAPVAVEHWDGRITKSRPTPKKKGSK